jgi:hypothetical protein
MEKVYCILIFLIIIYLIYRDFLKEPKTENFENITLGSADDQNAINKLAQISSELMKGGLTVPGAMTVTGAITGNGATQINGLFSANNGSRFVGGRHLFKDEENKGSLRVGAAWGAPGIFAEEGDLAIGARSGTVIVGGGNRMVVNKIETNEILIGGRNILAEINDLIGQAVRKDKQYYIDIGIRANGDGCCGNGSGLIIHYAGQGGPAHAHPDKNQTSRFSFRQV